jgi:hypothetical protein
MAVSVIAFSERYEGDGWLLVERNVMDWDLRTYSAFLAGVRNTSLIPPIAEPRGIPSDMSKTVADEFASALADGILGSDAVAPSWLSLEELLAFDYDRQFEDRQVGRRTPSGWIDHAVTAAAGEGRMVSYREFLGPGYFEELQRLFRSGAHRVVFWFSL